MQHRHAGTLSSDLPSKPQALLHAAATLAALTAFAQAQQQFASLGQRLPANHASVATLLGDVDGDGDPDLFCRQLSPYGYGPPHVQLFLNDGRASFAAAPAGSVPAAAAGSVGSVAGLVLGDVDGDGDLDLVSVHCQARNGVFLNDGQGTFTDVSTSSMPLDSFATRNGTLADIDGDGDLDLLCGSLTSSVTSPGAQNRLYLNDGQGVFTDETASRLPFDSDRTIEIAVGDVDGDGDLDIFCANGSIFFQQNRLYLNDGSGTFTDVTAAQLPALADASYNAVPADFDGDGDLDIACGGDWGWNRLLINDGAGTFTDETGQRLPSEFEVTAFIAGDFDLDGDLDLFAANAGFCNIFTYPRSCLGEQDKLYLNDGSGTFVDATARLPATADRTWGAVVGDLDADGDLDIAVGNVTGGYPYALVQDSTVLLNVQRQLDAPAAPTIGQSYQLDVYARYGEPRLFDVALPYVSFAPASIPLPSVGTVAIDPAQAFALPPLLIPQSAGVASTTLMIPNNPVLVGLDVYTQALHVPYPLPPRLTNATFGIVQ